MSDTRVTSSVGETPGDAGAATNEHQGTAPPPRPLADARGDRKLDTNDFLVAVTELHTRVTSSVSETPGGAGGATNEHQGTAPPPRPLADARGDRKLDTNDFLVAVTELHTKEQLDPLRERAERRDREGAAMSDT